MTSTSSVKSLTPSKRPRTAVQKQPSQLLHVIVRDRILADLVTTDLKPGDRYFTEDQLIEQHKVSRNTIRRAMAELSERGYVRRQRGRGSMISRKPLPSDTHPAMIHSPSAARDTSKLIVILPGWDDSTEGFYSARILRELASFDGQSRWAIEIRHPRDPLDLSPDPNLAILAMDPQSDVIHRLAELARQGVRIVATTPAYAIPSAINVCDAINQATFDAVKRFYQSGHRHVGIISGDAQHNDFRRAMEGFINAHRELEKSIHPHAIVQSTQLDPMNSTRINVSQVTAWVCTFGSAASFLADQCHAVGLTIPNDISLICFDHPSGQITASVGKLLSVVQPDAYQTAKTIMSCLENWDNKLRGQVIELSMQSVEGQTIAAGSGR